jgi:hypothetical protein
MSKIIQEHLELLVAKYRVREEKEFSNIQEIYSLAYFKSLKRRLRMLRFVSKVAFSWHPDSACACAFVVNFKARSAWGLRIEISTISPFYQTSFRIPGGDRIIDHQLVKRRGIKAISASFKSWAKRGAPASVKQNADKVKAELASLGLLHLSQEDSFSVPTRSIKIPKLIPRHRFGFYFFDSISLWEPFIPSVKGLKSRTKGR